MIRSRDLAARAPSPAELEQLAARLAPHLTVVRPPGPGPFPVVVQMHGCGGIQPLQARYAEAARRAGVAAVIVDSLAPRRIGRREAQLTVCTGLKLRGAERAADLLAMLQWLEGQSWADCGRVAAAGWSHGAWAVMDALAASDLDARSSARLDALCAAVLVYPYAGPLTRTVRQGWAGRRPRVFACVAGRDAVVGSLAPKRALARLRADGCRVELLELPHATHCFDDEYADDPRSRYVPELAARAEAFYARALAESLVQA